MAGREGPRQYPHHLASLEPNSYFVFLNYSETTYLQQANAKEKNRNSSDSILRHLPQIAHLRFANTSLDLDSPIWGMTNFLVSQGGIADHSCCALPGSLVSRRRDPPWYLEAHDAASEKPRPAQAVPKARTQMSHP